MARYRDYRKVRNCAEFRWNKVPHNLTNMEIYDFVQDTVDKEVTEDYTYTKTALYFKSEQDAFIIKLRLPIVA